MKKSIFAVFVLTLLAASAAQADVTSSGGNFVSGNKNNDGQYTPRKVRSADRAERVPGFWDKEWERSGLNKTVGGAWWSPLSKPGNFLEKKNAEYRAKHPATDAK